MKGDLKDVAAALLYAGIPFTIDVGEEQIIVQTDVVYLEFSPSGKVLREVKKDN
jgi:hypothetical protein